MKSNEKKYSQEVKRPERSTTFSFFAILQHKSTEWKTTVLGDFSRFQLQNRKDPHKISFSEPARALYMNEQSRIN